MAITSQPQRVRFPLALELGHAVWTGGYLLGLACVAEAQGQPVRAARLFGATQSLIDVNKHLDPVERAAYERGVASVRAKLGEKVFTAAWAEGCTMTPEQALAAKGAVVGIATAPAEPSAVLHAPKAPTDPGGTH